MTYSKGSLDCNSYSGCQGWQLIKTWKHWPTYKISLKTRREACETAFLFHLFFIRSLLSVFLAPTVPPPSIVPFARIWLWVLHLFLLRVNRHRLHVSKIVRSLNQISVCIHYQILRAHENFNSALLARCPWFPMKVQLEAHIAFPPFIISLQTPIYRL